MTLKAGHRWLLFAVVCATALLGACRKEDDAAAGSDPKAQIFRYLAKKAGQREFSPGIDLDLPQRVATLRSNVTVLTQRTAALRGQLRAGDAALERALREQQHAEEAARAELAREEEQLSHQEDTYIRSVRQQMSAVRSYEALYRLVGEQLTTADRLLAEKDASRRRMGLKFAREACNHVRSGSVDIWLAARICETYFWPNLGLADAQPGSREHALELLQIARRVFFDTYETNNVVRNYELLLANAPSAHAADTFRVQFADWMEEKGNLPRAAEALNEIRDAEVLASARDRITRVREAVAANR